MSISLKYLSPIRHSILTSIGCFFYPVRNGEGFVCLGKCRFSKVRNSVFYMCIQGGMPTVLID